LAELEVTENDIYQLTDFDKSINENVDKSEGMKIIPSPSSDLPVTNVDRSEGMKIIPSQNVDKSEGMKISTVFNNLKQDTLLDTKKIYTEKSSSDPKNDVSPFSENETDIEKLREQELLKHFAESNQDRSFLNTENLRLIALFSDSLLDAENIQGIILRAKKAAEKAHGSILVVDDEYVHNQMFDIQSEIANTLRRVYHKRKTDRKIKNFDNYAFGAFKNLFDSVIGNWKILISENHTNNSIATHDWVN
ncbi:hypothetical protein CI088_11650, partial [Enterococcus plantarum]